MAERMKISAPVSRLVPMKLFATWEVDRTPSNCIPRLCTLRMTRLIILRPLGNDLTSISIAVKMQSSKRTLRSNEIILSPNGQLDTELELQFALQYPHFLKRDGNKLIVLLQRKKKYKNRTMRGYKTLAEGVINMAQVLQKQQNLELELVSDKVEKYGGQSVALARVNIVDLSSQPVDHDKRLLNDPHERLCQEYSDEEEEYSSEGEPEGSDSEPTIDVLNRRKQRGKIQGNDNNSRHRNLKQKFISLLKKFRVSEELEHDQEEIEQKLSGGDMEIDELIDELEELSEDSGPELDTMSVNSTPKPSLRPFFSSSKSLLAPPNTVVSAEDTENAVAPAVASSPAASKQPKEKSRGGHTTPERGIDRHSDDSSRRADSGDSHQDNWTDHETNDQSQTHQAAIGQNASSPPKLAEYSQQSQSQQQQQPFSTNKDKDNKTSNESTDKKSNRLFNRDKAIAGYNKSKKYSLSVDLKPSIEQNNSEPRKALVEQLIRVLPDDNLPESVSIVTISDPGGAVLAARLQERNLRVLTTASPADVRATLTCLVTRLQKFCNSSAKPPAPIKVIIAGGDGFVNTVLRQYVDLLSFRPPDWQNYLRFLVVPLGSSQLSKYLASIDTSYSILFGDEWRELAERESGAANESAARVSEYLALSNSTLMLPIAEAMVTYRDTDDSSQIFVPFICEVRVGCPENNTSASVDLDEGAFTSNSPPALPSSNLPLPAPGRLTPPSSPNVSQPREGWEPVELQLDYWSKQSFGEKGKNSLRQAFKLLCVQRLPPLAETPGQYLLMNYVSKEKKQKIIRLGKKKEKEKENEPKSQTVEGVTRLICSAKTHNIPLKVNIDGTEWYGVKFFQLSSQWQTHIKTFPIGLLAYNSQHQISSNT